ncbi:MAG: chemotaxis protein CheW [Alphaproteobacteria bacterium]
MFPVGFQTIDGRMSPHPTHSPSHSPSTPSPFRCVVFSVAGQALALPVEAVRRFLPLPRLDRLPTAPQPVEGVFRYHGEVVPVMRLGVLLDLAAEGAAGGAAGGGGETGLYAPLILITWQGRPTALLVDQVHGDVVLEAEERVASDPSLSFNGCAAGAFPDRVTGRSGTVTLLDTDRLLSEAEGRLLDAFRAAEERRLARWDGAA